MRHLQDFASGRIPEDRERIAKLRVLDAQMREKSEELRHRQAADLKSEDALRKRKEELLKQEETYMQQFREHRAVHEQLVEVKQRGRSGRDAKWNEGTGRTARKVQARGRS